MRQWTTTTSSRRSSSASLVCKRWRRLLAEPYFLRRLRAHHREIPLLGFFADEVGVLRFRPLLKPPDRIPSERLSTVTYRDDGWLFLECRHGLALFLNRERMELTVWDPITGEKRFLAVPPGFSGQDPRLLVRSAALVCDDSKQAFRVIVLRHDHVIRDDKPQAFAPSVYESETGVWGNLISASIVAPLWLGKPSVLVGSSLCWWLRGYGNSGILEFDLERQNLAVIETPEDARVTQCSNFQILRTEDNGLGLAVLSDVSIQVWERKANSGGFAIWMLYKTIELDKFLPLPRETSAWLFIQGYDEDGNWIFIWTKIGVFMIQLKYIHFRNLFKTNSINNYHPYRNFYTTGTRICLPARR